MKRSAQEMRHLQVRELRTVSGCVGSERKEDALLDDAFLDDAFLGVEVVVRRVAGHVDGAAQREKSSSPSRRSRSTNRCWFGWSRITKEVVLLVTVADAFDMEDWWCATGVFVTWLGSLFWEVK